MRQFNNRPTNNGNYNNNRVPANYQQQYDSSNYYDSMDNYDNTNQDDQANDLYGGPIRNNFQFGNKSHHTNRYNPFNNPSSSSGGQDYDSYNNNNNYAYSGQQTNNKNYHQNNNNNYQQQPNNYPQQLNNKSFYQDQSGHTIFVYNIGLNTEEQLHQLFSKFGQVNSVRKNKGFAFVTMSKYENAANAIANLDNHTFNNQKIQVSFKK